MASKFAKAGLIIVINAIACLIPVIGYYAYGKLTYPAYFCGSFAQVDGEIGWVIAPNVTSCMGGRAPFSSGPPWYEAKVFTNADGFRTGSRNAATPRGGIMTIGDSWTFGYGVSFEDSYPGQLQRSGTPVVVAASPAYGTAQALLLAERWAPRLAPRAMVYLDQGFWERSACSGGSRPVAILKPCYWQAPGTTNVELVQPPQGRVAAFAAFGVLPGGMVGAGEDTWTYFLISRPVALIHQALARAGMVPGFGDDFRAVGVDTAAIQRGTFEHIVRLVTAQKVPLVLLDPFDTYAPYVAALPKDVAAYIHHIGQAKWGKAVTEPAAKLAPELAAVPHDGHFGPGTNALVAKLVSEQLDTAGVAVK